VTSDGARRHAVGAVLSVAAVAVVTGAVYGLRPVAPVVSLGALYVFAVLPVAVLGGIAYALPVALASALVFEFLFLPPLHTFRLRDSENWVALTVYAVTALVASELAARARRRAREAGAREQEAALLAEIAALLLEPGEVQEKLREISERVASFGGSRRGWIELGSLRRPREGESAHVLAVGGRDIGRLFLDGDAVLAPATAARFLPGLASLLAAAVEREQLARSATAAEALRRSDEAKTAILRAVGHDLRSPLTAIRAAVEGLGSPSITLTDADRRELLSTIRGETLRLDRLVANLIDLSRLEAGVAPARPELWAVDALVERALDGLGDEGERIRVELPGGLPPVLVDAAQIERALVNLLGNALRVSSNVELEAAATRAGVSLRVVDHGPGIEPARLEGIFDPFESPGGPRVGRAGLGLAIARGFVEANDGRIWVESRSGEGAVFGILLPTARQPAETR